MVSMATIEHDILSANLAFVFLSSSDGQDVYILGFCLAACTWQLTLDMHRIRRPHSKDTSG